jgi:hypothetical protein
MEMAPMGYCGNRSLQPIFEQSALTIVGECFAETANFINLFNVRTNPNAATIGCTRGTVF